MITIQSGKMIIPENERFVGFAGDNLTCTKVFLVPDAADSDSDYILYLRFDNDAVTSAVLDKSADGDDLVLTWNVRSEHLLRSGVILAQIKITDGDVTVAHTGCDYFIAAPGSELGDDGGELDMISRTEFERRMGEAVALARATAPYIGDDGYWYVYSPEEGDYVRSWSAGGSAVDSEISATSTNPVQNKVVKAYVDAAAANIPTAVSQLTNDSGYLTAHQDITGKMNLLQRIGSSSDLSTVGNGQLFACQGVFGVRDSSQPGGYTQLITPSYISTKEETTNKVTSLSSSSTDTEYPSAKCVYDALGLKANASSVPTKTSDLTNDSGFLTAHQNISGAIPIDFKKHAGLVDSRDLSLYGNVTLGNYHTSIPVSPGEKYIISCRSSNAVYPGAFYTLNGTKVSSIFEDNATHLDVTVTVPTGVDTLWLNSKASIIPLNNWLMYKVLPAPDYSEINNSAIRSLQSQRNDEALETLRRLLLLEKRDTFSWKPFDKAYYCFINDGSNAWVHVFYDVFHAHNVPFCAAVVGSNIELANDTETSPGGRTVKQTLDAIVADGGEIMVYLNANQSDVGTFDGYYSKAVTEGKRLIESYGYKTRGLILSNDCTGNTAIGQEICERFFDYADHVGTKKQFNLRRAQFSDTSTVADVKAYIDSTVNTPGFYPIMMHRPTMEPWASYAGMDEILTYIEGKGSSAAVSTYSAVFDAFGTNGYLTLSDLPVYNGGVQ